jgi:cytochrome c oxidase subunit II
MFSRRSDSGHAPRRSPGGRRADLAALALSVVVVACRGEGAAFPQTTFFPVTAVGDAQNAVFYNTFWWTMAILIVVCSLILFAALRFREQPGAPHPEQIHGSTKLEVAWTVIPAIVVVFIAVPTVRTIFATQQHDHADALDIEVIGHQWWWEFRYPQYDVTTANQFYVPVDRKVRLRMHSADVVHSFWIPRFGGKRDVNPLSRVLEGVSDNLNFISFTPREPGLYHGQCAEFCGVSHAIMLMTAVAVPEAEFDDWIASMQELPPEPELPPAPIGVAPADAEQVVTEPPPPPRPALPAPTGIGQRVEPPLSMAELAAEGEEIFMRTVCVACHAVANTTARGTLGPNLTRYAARPTVGAGAARNTQENVEAWIRDPHAMKPGALMPGTRTGGGGMPATNLTDEEVRAVAAYLMSLR